jgi:tetratricopeptide (TPR) repeat protein
MRLTTVRLAAALVGCLIIAAAAVPGAAAPPDLDWSACNNHQDHDASMSGCTRIIDRGNREPATGRALAYRNRADAYFRKGDADQAIYDAGEAIRLDPKLPMAYNTRGHAYLSKHEYDRAIRDYDEAIRLNPKFGTYYANRGSAYYARGDVDRAIQDADEAIRLDPNDARAYSGRGAAYREKGDLRRATVELEAAIRLNPNLARAYFHRGLLFQLNGDRDRAMADLRHAVELEKNEAFAREAREALAKIEVGSTDRLPTPTPTERRVALVLGNSDYKAAATLPNPRRDAEAVAAALRGVGFEVTLAGDLSRDKLVDALRAFAAASEKADWAVIYFAGHGIELGGVNYLVPVDARLVADRDVQFEAVPLDQVLGAVEGARKLRMVLLDACRENPFARRMQRTLAARSVGRGLARIEPGPGTLVAYAARDGQVALDGDGQNSPFAASLVKLLKRPGLEVNKLFRLVHDDVMDATGNRQEPYTYGALPGREDFFFVAR